MKTPKQNSWTFLKKHKALFIFLTLLVIICTWWAYANFMPHPLGDKMEYLGKEDYGNILGFDSAPYSVYYYGTGMEPEEMKNYFTAQYLPLENLAYKHASFTADGKDFMFTYEFQSSFTTHKKYIVSIPNSQYKLAKSHLK